MSSWLAELLEPWVRKFTACDVQWGSVAGGSGYGVIIQFSVDATETLLGQGNVLFGEGTVAEKLLHLREAMDLFHILMLVSPSQLEAFVAGRWWLTSPECRAQRETLHAITRNGVPCQVRFRLHYKNINAHVLHSQLAVYFFDVLGRRLSTREKFVALRGKMLAAPSDRLLLKERAAKSSSVHVVLAVDSDWLQSVSDLDAVDFFSDLTTFASVMKEYTRPLLDDEAIPRPPPSRWDMDETHVPLILDKVELTLRRFCITHDVAHHAQAFMAIGIPVEWRHITLDPRLISCVRDDAIAFMRALAPAAKDLAIKTGSDHRETNWKEIDRNGKDRRGLLSVLFEAIASIQQAHHVDLGGLLSLCLAETNRRCIFDGMFSSSVLARRQPRPPVKVLRIGDFVILDETDAPFILGAAATWRAANPGDKLCLQSLPLGFFSMENTAIDALLSSIDDVENVKISRAEGNLNADLTTDNLLAVLRYPSLRTLDLAGVVVETMDLFDPCVPDARLPRKPLLEKLPLQDMTLEDLPSMDRFLGILQDTSCSQTAANPLAKTLVDLKIHHISDPCDCYALDEKAARMLDAVLYTNGILQEVSVMLRIDDAAAAATSETFLLVHNLTNHHHVPVSPSRLSAPR